MAISESGDGTESGLLRHAASAISLTVAFAFSLGALYLFGQFCGAGQLSALNYLTFSDFVNNAVAWAIPSFLGLGIGQLSTAAFETPIKKIAAGRPTNVVNRNRRTFTALALLIVVIIACFIFAAMGWISLLAAQTITILFCIIPATLGSWKKYVAPKLSHREGFLGYLAIANAWIALVLGLIHGYFGVEGKNLTEVQTSAGRVYSPLSYAGDRGIILLDATGSTFIPWDKINKVDRHIAVSLGQ